MPGARGAGLLERAPVRRRAGAVQVTLVSDAAQQAHSIAVNPIGGGFEIAIGS